MKQRTRRLCSIISAAAIVAAALPTSRASAATLAAVPNVAGFATAAEVAGRIALTVRDTTGIARTNEVVRQGIPLPKSLGLRSTAGLAVVNPAGARVPAEFVVLGRWNAGLAATTAPIQWLLVAFPATVAANAAATYHLVYDGSAGANPAPARPLTLTRSGNIVTVNTGAARFTIGGTAGLLDSASNAAGSSVISAGGAMTVTTAVTSPHTTIRSVRVEHAGPLYASVVVYGAYGTPAVGGGGIGSTRRYVFTAGSPLAQVRHALAWEGSRCDAAVRCPDGTIQGVSIRQARDTLNLTASAPFTVAAAAARAVAPLTGTAAAGQTAAVRQLARSSRTAPPAYQATVATTTVTGRQADAGMLTAGTAAGAVTVATMQLNRNEPQALRLLGNGDLAVDIVDSATWLTTRQGLYATIAVAALPANPSAATVNRLVWAPLNHPLHAWPSQAWFNASRVVGELPAATLAAPLTDYNTYVGDVIRRTYTDIDQLGINGLTTFGLYPTYWGSFEGDEVDCYPDNDPTPNTAADNAYWCGTWTDYHNTATTLVLRAMQTGGVADLDNLATPAALRMLHTQIMQCSPGDDWFYCGQAPAGYGSYREDFNSSHAYFENLFLYYWLTGDSTVVDTVRRGAASMREYNCDRRPAAACTTADPPTHEGLVSRVASQWFAAYRFVGQASSDASYLDDWRSGLARAVTYNYIEAKAGVVSYGFWVSDQVTGPGRYATDQLWLASIYDMENLRRLQIDTDDAPIGNPAIRPSRILAAWARTLVRYGSRVIGDGTAAGQWANGLNVTFSGGRIGGTITSVTANYDYGDDFLWNSGKATLTAVIMRAAVATNDATLRQMGAALTRHTLTEAEGEADPLGKVAGIYLARMPAAVAILTGSGWGV